MDWWRSHLSWTARAWAGTAAWASRASARSPVDLHTLCVLGVADRPAEPLDELHRRVVVAEMHRVDPLVEQCRGVVSVGLVGYHDDSGHGSPFLGFVGGVFGSWASAGALAQELGGGGGLSGGRAIGSPDGGGCATSGTSTSPDHAGRRRYGAGRATRRNLAFRCAGMRDREHCSVSISQICTMGEDLRGSVVSPLRDGSRGAA